MVRSPRTRAWRIASLLLATVALAGIVGARPWWLRGVPANGQDFLPPDAAFRVSAQLDGKRVTVRWDIAHGYYLYRNKIHVAAESPDLIVEPLTLPPGALLTDRYFGPQEVYYRRVEGHAAYTRLDFGAHPMQIKLTYQGCAEAGLCYPPIVKVIYPTEMPAAASAVAAPGTQAEWFLILAALAGFLAAGLALRRGRALPSPGL
ncbi:MAG: protein-disulfide reductase DsbD N-terminal domain-containing protein [Gammaproteobacteria bacterium]|nr:protein-disulfide reductase DsbD N-terminal domain-containing protein [Gammaproteobacteria bacterium]